MAGTGRNDWEEINQDEFRFFDGLMSRKEAPDAEHFVSDYTLAQSYVSSQIKGAPSAMEIELEMT